jgi:hypothetical protein
MILLRSLFTLGALEALGLVLLVGGSLRTGNTILGSITLELTALVAAPGILAGSNWLVRWGRPRMACLLLLVLVIPGLLTAWMSAVLANCAGRFAPRRAASALPQHCHRPVQVLLRRLEHLRIVLVHWPMPLLKLLQEIEDGLLHSGEDGMWLGTHPYSAACTARGISPTASAAFSASFCAFSREARRSTSSTIWSTMSSVLVVWLVLPAE